MEPLFMLTKMIGWRFAGGGVRASYGGVKKTYGGDSSIFINDGTGKTL